MGNIFAVEPKQLYTESPTSDKYAKVGLGGIPGAILAVGDSRRRVLRRPNVRELRRGEQRIRRLRRRVRFVLLGEIFLVIPRL